jgi:hypothetical protein
LNTKISSLSIVIPILYRFSYWPCYREMLSGVNILAKLPETEGVVAKIHAID